MTRQDYSKIFLGLVSLFYAVILLDYYLHELLELRYQFLFLFTRYYDADDLN